MKRLFIIFFFFALIGAGMSHAQEIITTEGSPLESTAEPNIQVKWKGEMLLCSDSLSWAAGQTVGDHAETFMVTRENGWQTDRKSVV